MSLHDCQLDSIRRDFLIRLTLDKYRLVSQDRWHTMYQRQWVRVLVDDIGIFIFAYRPRSQKWIRLNGHDWESCRGRCVCPQKAMLMPIVEE